jgi:hypothetical protein
MKNSTQPKTWVRVVNGLAALALAALVLGMYWPTVKLSDLHVADLGYQGEWIEGHAKRITAVTPGGPVDRAGLQPGDVLEFDPGRNDDWVLAGYRDTPEGFTGTLTARYADGTRSSVTLAPVRSAYLPTLNDRIALVARLAGLTIVVLVGVALVWARPCLMTWSCLLGAVATSPSRVWVPYFEAYVATSANVTPLSYVAYLFLCCFHSLLIFALCFPNPALPRWSWWKRAALVTAPAPVFALFAALVSCPFARDNMGLVVSIWAPLTFLTTVAAVGALLRTYRRSAAQDRARLKWAIVGLSSFLAALGLGVVGIAMAQFMPSWRSGNPLTPVHWLYSVAQGAVWPFTIGYAVLRLRVVDIQFAISRTVVYGVVSTIVLLFLAALHWLLGRLIEHSGLAFGLEGVAAVGLGLVLHRASHGINRTVDRVLFSKHHAAEERLRQVTAALPYASTERSIAEALVNEPVHNLKLASAALFYRDSPEGALQRVRSEGWGDSHAAGLDPESLLVRYLQAEHAAVRLDDAQQWLPAGMPEGSAHPVLAIPIVTQHVLTAVVLYGAHVNATLPDPDEVTLLEALAKAAATSHQQVRIAMLQREVAALSRETQAQQMMLQRFEAKLGALVQRHG